MELQVLKILIHTEKTRETILNIWYLIDVSFLSRGVLVTLSKDDDTG